MRQRAQDVVLATLFLLAFPGAIHLTHLASSEPGDPGRPTPRETGRAAATGR